MKVSMVMKSPAVTCLPSTSVKDVCHLMAEQAVGCAVVVHADGSVVGIVTDRDLALRALGAGRSADIPVEQVMTRNVARVFVGADVSHAEDAMCEHRVRRLPVIDSLGRIHGVIALDDILRNISHQADEVSDLLRRQAVVGS